MFKWVSYEKMRGALVPGERRYPVGGKLKPSTDGVNYVQFLNGRPVALIPKEDIVRFLVPI